MSIMFYEVRVFTVVIVMAIGSTVISLSAIMFLAYGSSNIIDRSSNTIVERVIDNPLSQFFQKTG